MERTLFETIQMLGLDAQLGIILLLFTLDGLGTMGRRVAAWLGEQPRRVRRRVVANRPATATDVEAWPSESLAERGRQAA